MDGGSRHDQDRADATTAAELEARAEAVVLVVDGAEDAIRAIAIRGGGRARRPSALRSVGLRREAMRVVARDLAPDAVPLLTQADAIYWRMVLRHEPLQKREANRAANRVPELAREVLAVMRLGWFRAAVRWEPNGTATFPGYALAWGRVAWQWANERQSTVEFGKARAMAEAKGWGRVETLSLDVPFYEDKTTPWVDYLEADEVCMEDLLMRDRVRAELQRLEPRERDIVSRLADGEHASEIAPDHGLQKSRVSHIARLALDALRSRLDGRPA